MRRKGKSKVWSVIGVVVGLIVVLLAGALLFTSKERREAGALPIAVVDFNKLDDGTYVGEYAGGMYRMRATKVEVTLSSGKVTEIKLLKGAMDKEGQPAVLAKGLSIHDLFGRVIESQSLQVDTISGATLTSKAHLKAVENALEQAQAK
ncbi:MAG: FMN-binding protein [Bacillota bacterium]|jgi:uncharacterized protein with FMN-binding domain